MMHSLLMRRGPKSQKHLSVDAIFKEELMHPQLESDSALQNGTVVMEQKQGSDQVATPNPQALEKLEQEKEFVCAAALLGVEKFEELKNLTIARLREMHEATKKQMRASTQINIYEKYQLNPDASIREKFRIFEKKDPPNELGSEQIGELTKKLEEIRTLEKQINTDIELGLSWFEKTYHPQYEWATSKKDIMSKARMFDYGSYRRLNLIMRRQELEKALGKHRFLISRAPNQAVVVDDNESEIVFCTAFLGLETLEELLKGIDVARLQMLHEINKNEIRSAAKIDFYEQHHQDPNFIILKNGCSPADEEISLLDTNLKEIRKIEGDIDFAATKVIAWLEANPKYVWATDEKDIQERDIHFNRGKTCRQDLLRYRRAFNAYELKIKKPSNVLSQRDDSEEKDGASLKPTVEKFALVRARTPYEMVKTGAHRKGIKLEELYYYVILHVFLMSTNSTKLIAQRIFEEGLVTIFHSDSVSKLISQGDNYAKLKQIIGRCQSLQSCLAESVEPDWSDYKPDAIMSVIMLGQEQGIELLKFYFGISRVNLLDQMNVIDTKLDQMIRANQITNLQTAADREQAAQREKALKQEVFEAKQLAVDAVKRTAELAERVRAMEALLQGKNAQPLLVGPALPVATAQGSEARAFVGVHAKNNSGTARKPTPARLRAKSLEVSFTGNWGNKKPVVVDPLAQDSKKNEKRRSF